MLFSCYLHKLKGLAEQCMKSIASRLPWLFSFSVACFFSAFYTIMPLSARSMNTTWVPVPDTSHYTIHNLPYGIFSHKNSAPRVGVAIGDYVLDLSQLAQMGIFGGIDLQAHHAFNQPTLNMFMEAGPAAWSAVRHRIQHLLSVDNASLRDDTKARAKCLIPAAEVTMHMPVSIGDYTDFYSSMQHATNVGMMFRDPANALLPNWKHLPVGYHGRASSVVLSGTNLHRPHGQVKGPNDVVPRFAPSAKLDFELEMGFFIGKGNDLGQTILAADWRHHVFGFCIFNDWSARDHQAWEYVPLGPFLGKNFGSSISPWVVPLAALEPFLIEGEPQDQPILPYLQTDGPTHIDLQLEVWLQPEGSTEEYCIVQSNYKNMYWSVAQQLAHHTVNGCNMRTGDLCASGTISGAEPESFGSMLELSWNGTKPISLPNGETRTFIQDGDTIIMKAFAQKGVIRIGFGEVRGKVLPAIDYPAKA